MTPKDFIVNMLLKGATLTEVAYRVSRHYNMTFGKAIKLVTSINQAK